MKKTIAIAMGIFALVLVATPAMAIHLSFGYPHSGPDERLENTVRVNNMSVSLANSGLNRQTGGGTLRTGAALSTSMNATQVNIGVMGCCEEEESSCCRGNRNRCGCGYHREEASSSTVNTVMVNNGSLALANSGLNSQSGSRMHHVKPCRGRPPMQTGLLATGRADAYSGNETLVNILVSGMD